MLLFPSKKYASETTKSGETTSEAYETTSGEAQSEANKGTTKAKSEAATGEKSQKDRKRRQMQAWQGTGQVA